MGFKVIHPGLLTTVQDLGRMGYQHSGFSPTGAMDQKSCRLANLLVGNSQTDALLEMTLMGATLELTTDVVAAVTGADMGFMVNGALFPAYRALPLIAGDQIKFSGAKNGCRTYIAFAGGIDVPVVMGSRSTNMKCTLGGFHGRKLQAEDELKFGNQVRSVCRLEKRHISAVEENITRKIRVVPGPQEVYFTKQGLETFYSGTYVVTPETDRMGSKLEGPPIEYKDKVDIISDGIPFGGIQISSNGRPIIMLADRQTTGGYAKIGTVATVDLPLIAQKKMQDTIQFERTTVQEAQKLYIEQEHQINELEQRFLSLK